MPTMADSRILPRITHEDVNETEGVFTVEPLDRGYGYTFGNSLRRVLLSSLEGAAVTQVKIEGALHEFTTVAGVREDVIDLILNLKGLVCRIHGDDELKEVEADIVKEGPGKVYARDIAAPSDLEIINPDLYICELQDGARLEMTLTIAKGRGYVPAEGNKSHESDDRGHPGRRHLLARAARDVPRRRRPRRAADGLRQADDRRQDRTARSIRARRSSRPPRSSSSS